MSISVWFQSSLPVIRYDNVAVDIPIAFAKASCVPNFSMIRPLNLLYGVFSLCLLSLGFCFAVQILN